MLSVQKLNEKQLNRCLEKKQKELDELEKNIENLEREVSKKRKLYFHF